MSTITITAKFASKCAKCGKPIAAGARASFDKDNRTVAHLRGTCAAAPETVPVAEQKPDVVDQAKTPIIGKVRYKGHEYLMLWEGHTKRGYAAKLCFRDGSKVFWADANDYQIVKRYARPLTIARLDELAAEYREQQAAEAKANEQYRRESAMAPEQRIAEAQRKKDEAIARATELAGKAGVTVIGTDIRGFSREGKNAASVGELTSSRDKKTSTIRHYIIVSVDTAYYHSEDECEDMDCFCGRYGWQTPYAAIEVSEPDAVRTAREKVEAGAATEAARGQAEKDAYAAAKAKIPSDLARRHGAMWGGAVQIGAWTDVLHPVADGMLRTDQIRWTQVAQLVEHGKGGLIEGRVQNMYTLYCATLADGRRAYREATYTGFGDDERETYWMPQDLWLAVCTAEIRARGITRESATDWLAKYRGCVDTELYELAATLEPAPECIEAKS